MKIIEKAHAEACKEMFSNNAPIWVVMADRVGPEYGGAILFAYLKAAIRAIQEAGWAIVPRDLTAEMSVIFGDPNYDSRPLYEHWAATIAAAPDPLKE